MTETKDLISTGILDLCVMFVTYLIIVIYPAAIVTCLSIEPAF